MMPNKVLCGHKRCHVTFSTPVWYGTLLSSLCGLFPEIHTIHLFFGHSNILLRFSMKKPHQVAQRIAKCCQGQKGSRCCVAGLSFPWGFDHRLRERDGDAPQQIKTKHRCLLRMYTHIYNQNTLNYTGTLIYNYII